ncbi:hypothetical protein EDD79_10511, partial [Serpentinicella alkaliphila]
LAIIFVIIGKVINIFKNYMDKGSTDWTSVGYIIGLIILLIQNFFR